MRTTYDTRVQSQKGFTLLELIVSVALFTIVVTIVMGAYLAIIDLDRRARATNDLVANFNFVVDGMSRSLRTGMHYGCQGGTNCTTGGTYISFVDESCRPVTYIRRSDNTVAQCVGTANASNCSATRPSFPSCTDSNSTPLTDPRVQVQNMTFFTQGVGTSDTLQPRVIFTLTGVITPDPRSTPITFTLEGAATQRLIEI